VLPVDLHKGSYCWLETTERLSPRSRKRHALHRRALFLVRAPIGPSRPGEALAGDALLELVGEDAAQPTASAVGSSHVHSGDKAQIDRPLLHTPRSGWILRVAKRLTDPGPGRRVTVASESCDDPFDCRAELRSRV
jgi:hypothetical protein